MYLSDRGLHKVLRKGKNGDYSDYQKRLIERHRKFNETPLDKIKYRVHKRAAAQVQRKEDGTPVANVKDCFAHELKFQQTPTKKLKERDIAILDMELDQ